MGRGSPATATAANWTDVIRIVFIVALVVAGILGGIHDFDSGKDPSPTLDQHTLPELDVYSSDPAVQMTLGVEARQGKDSSNTLSDTIELAATRTPMTKQSVVYFLIVVRGAGRLRSVETPTPSNIQVLATPRKSRGHEQLISKHTPQIVVGSLRMLPHLHDGDIAYEVATFQQRHGYSASGTYVQAQLPTVNGRYQYGRASFLLDPSKPTGSLVKRSVCPPSTLGQLCFWSPNQIYSAAQLRTSLMGYKVLEAFPSSYVEGANVNWSNVFGLRPLIFAITDKSENDRSRSTLLAGVLFGIAGAGALAFIAEITRENREGLKRLKLHWPRRGSDEASRPTG